jgi:zinc D-Ala-D-Ala dipeptidase
LKPWAVEPVAILDRIRLVENGEPLLSIPELVPEVVVPRPTTIPWARERVVDMLRQAARSLPNTVRLGVTEAWRPLRRQMRHYDRYRAQLRGEHPEWPEPTLRRMTNRFFHPYGRKQPPGHCTGGAVDVRLYSLEGEELDMSSPFERWDGAPTAVQGLTPEAAANRKLMVDAMLGAGFSNYPLEFWHYSYGDAAWAYRVGVGECPYGMTELPEDIWREAEEESIRLMK